MPQTKRTIAVWLILSLLPFAAATVALTVGRYALSAGQVYAALLGHITGVPCENAQIDTVVFSIRLPRVLLALLVGAGLSASGTAFQSLFANPLATPDTLGVASGASFGAVLALFFGWGMLPVQLMAMAMGLLAVALTYLASTRREGLSLVAVVLAGIVVGSFFTALVSLVKYVADTESQLPAITYWLMGSLNSASYATLSLGAPFILFGIAVLFLLRWRLNVLPLSEDEARSTGTNIPLLRALTVLSATMVTASCVSMCGQVGWVGLLVPHICRMLLGSDNRRLVPASILLGGTFMVLVDTLARSLTASEIPVSILTALIGAPVFVALLRRTGGWSL